MKDRDIDYDAKIFEEKAQLGESKLLSQMVRELSPQDRLAVARRMDQLRQDDPSLPKLEFTSGGDLKSVDVNYKQDDYYGRQSQHMEFDTSTGQLKSTDMNYFHDGPDHTDFDKNGNKVSEDIKNTDNSSVHKEFDPVTGKPASSKTTFNDGSSRRDVYDIPSGKIVETDLNDSGSSTVNHYDLATGKLSSDDLTIFRTGTKFHDTYNPDTGKKDTMDMTFKDGPVASEHISYDVNTGNELWRDTTYRDGRVAHSGKQPKKTDVAQK